jgi:hypothetical protein
VIKVSSTTFTHKRGTYLWLVALQEPEYFNNNYSIHKLDGPTSWRVLKKRADVNDASEEAIFTMQGILTSKDMPPILEKPRQVTISVPGH